jgi:hypothetical protein
MAEELRLIQHLDILDPLYKVSDLFELALRGELPRMTAFIMLRLEMAWLSHHRESKPQ